MPLHTPVQCPNTQHNFNDPDAKYDSSHTLFINFIMNIIMVTYNYAYTFPHAEMMSLYTNTVIHVHLAIIVPPVSTSNLEFSVFVRASFAKVFGTKHLENENHLWSVNKVLSESSTNELVYFISASTRLVHLKL